MTRLRILAQHRCVVIMAVICAGSFGALALFGPWWAWLLVPLGVAAQLLNEYNLHRHVFHLSPPRRQWAFDLLYQAHYGHHDFPTNHALFFVPIWVALPMLAGNFALVWAVAWVFGAAQPFWIALAIVPAGGVAMFLVYEWFHMTAHLTLPKSAVSRRVTRLHNQHHFRDFSKWFHVSPGGEIIDRAMGTEIDKETLKQQQRQTFIRTLGMRPDDPRLVAARQRFASKYGLSAAEIAVAARGGSDVTS
ncbi:fatty acid hydroxylase [Sulfitobacter sp. F26204]|uniref:sterol desaturase family protein n=1 Tax=Sulfitobacter sp. F26204 TaxID=2996014 RepID=UPI00225E3494|nr:sterol desaturase family protein [Sulfitobacter sp. F26204]MCX7559472.1 fatty acid hydroxylase [Sulfitobacter sp. F26204]